MSNQSKLDKREQQARYLEDIIEDLLIDEEYEQVKELSVELEQLNKKIRYEQNR